MWRWIGALVVCSMVIAGRASLGETRALSSVEGRPATVVVRSGETLWQIARRITAPEQDVRATVHRLEVANGLRPGTSLAAGTNLDIRSRRAVALALSR